MSLEAQDLMFAYGSGSRPVFQGLDAEFPPGTLTALTGPSGSGKSTLLYVLALMARATAGRVVWDGIGVESLDDAQRARLRAAHMGFVFQDAMLDPTRSIRDNVCESALFAGMPRRIAAQQAEELMACFGVEHRASHRPGQISGGQAQRVALCRALMTRPRVVFADEPTGNLDRVSARVVWQALVDHAHAGATVILATHDENLADRCDQRLILT